MKFIDIHRHSPIDNKEIKTVINLDKDFAAPANQLFTVGIHPWWIKEINLKDGLKKMSELSESEHFLAFGEMGLDRAIETDFDLQIKYFEAQIELAKLFSKKVVIIHCVRAFNEILSVVNRLRYPGVLIFHDFNAGEVIAQELTKKGHILSFGRHLFNPVTKAYKVFEQVPLTQILLETDDWYQVEIEGVYQEAAKLRGIEFMEFKKIIHDNYQRIFSK